MDKSTERPHLPASAACTPGRINRILRPPCMQDKQEWQVSASAQLSQYFYTKAPKQRKQKAIESSGSFEHTVAVDPRRNPSPEGKTCTAAPGISSSFPAAPGISPSSSIRRWRRDTAGCPSCIGGRRGGADWRGTATTTASEGAHGTGGDGDEGGAGKVGMRIACVMCWCGPLTGQEGNAGQARKAYIRAAGCPQRHEAFFSRRGQAGLWKPAATFIRK